MIFGVGAVAIIIDTQFFSKYFFNAYFHILTGIFGILILSFSIRIAKITGRILSRYGKQGDIPKFETNKLVDIGPYKYMRHPMHFGLLFMPIGWGLVLGSPTFLLIFAPLEVIFILIMIYLVEEPEVKRKFGDEYMKKFGDKPWFCIRYECLRALINYDI